jgi:tetratricopeptide (TPR) repeat protein
VEQEIELWCRSRPVGNLLLVLTEGEIVWDPEAGDFDWTRTSALPRCLANQFPYEPLYLDLRWARAEDHLSSRDPRFQDAVANLSSAIRGLSKDDLVGMDVREHRRTMRIARVVGFALLALTAAAVTSAIRATSALHLAEQRRVQARGVAEAIVFEVNASLLGVPEAEQARVALGHKAQDLLDVLGGSIMDVRATRAAMAQHGSLADEAFAHGKLDVARKELEDSLRLAKQLVGQDPMNSAFRRDVSVCLNKLGDVLSAAHDLDGAARYVAQDVALSRELLARDPASLRGRTDLAVALEKLGNLCLAKGDVAGARAHLDEDAAIMRELHAAYPTNLDTTAGLSIALVQAGELALQQGALARARSDLSDAVALARPLAQQPASDAQRTRNLTVALLKLGDVDIALGAPAKAQPSFDEALRLRRGLLARRPDDAGMQRDVAVVLGRVAAAAFGLHDSQAGLAPMAEAIEFYERQVARPGSDDEARRELAVNLYDLAGAEAQLRKYPEARDHLARSIELLRGTAFQAPTSAPRQELFQALRRAGLVELALNDVSAAAALHAEACRLTADVPAEALREDRRTEWILDLAQIVEAHLPRGGDPRVGRLCADEALRQLALLRGQSEQVWQGKDLQATLQDLQRYATPRRP